MAAMVEERDAMDKNGRHLHVAWKVLLGAPAAMAFGLISEERT